MDFNSHAHVERDMCGTNFGNGAKISTHTLTWSVTTGLDTLDDELLHFNSHAHVERDVKDSIYSGKLFISTHTLTWSVTLSASKVRKSSYTFQLTRSRGA